jgi:hypothetical protein
MVAAASAAARPRFQPMGLGELLDRTIRLYRQNFVTFVGIVAIVQVPLAFVNLLVNFINLNQLANFDPTNTRDFGPVFAMLGTQGLIILVSIVSAILIYGVGQAALTRAVTDSYLGEKVSVGSAYRRIGNRWLGLVGTLVVAYVVLFVIGLYALIVPCLGWLTGPGVFMFFAGCVLPLVATVAVIERRGGLGALRRTWDLTRTRFWWMIGVTILLFVLSLAIVSGPSLVIGALLGLVLRPLIEATSPLTGQLAVNAVQQLTSAILGVLVYPIQLTALTLVYFDLRARSEGLDLAVQTAPAEVPTAEVIANAPAATGTSLITQAEALWFFALSLAVFVLYFGLIFGYVALASVFAPRGGPGF